MPFINCIYILFLFGAPISLKIFKMHMHFVFHTHLPLFPAPVLFKHVQFSHFFFVVVFFNKHIHLTPWLRTILLSRWVVLNSSEFIEVIFSIFWSTWSALNILLRMFFKMSLTPSWFMSNHDHSCLQGVLFFLFFLQRFSTEQGERSCLS